MTTEWFQPIQWYTVIQLIHGAVWPLARSLFKHLPDQGYALSKTLGLLLVGALSWLGFAYGILPHSPIGSWIALGAVAIASRGLKTEPAQTDMRRSWTARIAVEGLFLATFLGWIWVRMHDPDANHTEQPMDLMMLHGLWNANTFPPPDPWLANHPVGYYYFGYWLMLTPAKLAGIPPALAYNIGQACWLALLVTGCFGVVFNLIRAHGGLTSALWGGIWAAFLVAFTSNVAGFLDANPFRKDSPVDTGWWWWKASRAIQDAGAAGQSVDMITEFPFFSYLLGDNHPHVLAMPFSLLTVGLALNLWFRPRPSLLPPQTVPNFWIRLRLAFQSWPKVFPLGWTGVWVSATVLGAALAANTWDFPGQWGLLMGVAALAWLRGDDPFPARLRRMLPPLLILALSITVLAVAIYLPYLLYAQSQARGFRLNLAQHTSLIEWLKVYGFHLPGLALLAALGLAGIRKKTLNASAPLLFLLLLAALGAGLALAPEVVFVRDQFETRMNTVFKFHYQAWLYLGLACAGGVGLVWQHPSRGLRAVSVAVAMAWMAGWAYPLRALDTKTAHFSRTELTLDATDWVRSSDADTWAAIQWLARQAAPDAVIAEAAGESYHADHNRFSSLTGRATLLGWQGHEVQWRDARYGEMARGRADILRALYSARTPILVERIVKDWRIDYVIDGPPERLIYGTSAERPSNFDKALRLVFEKGHTRIYERRP